MLFRSEVLDGADNDDVVLEVAHDLELVFLPADDGFLDEDFPHRAHGEAPVHMALEFLAIVGDVSAGAACNDRRWL